MSNARGTIRIGVALLALGLYGCGNGDVAANGGKHPDAGPADAGPVDAGHVDAGHVDAGPQHDAGARADAGPTDGGCGLRTCANSGANCGPIGDGCGNLIQCGDCTPPETCGGGGVPNFCGGNSGCVPSTCPSLGATCGPVSDGCGTLLDCGDCTLPETCGGGGTAYQCGTSTVQDGGHLEPDAGCLPLTCAQANANCGPVGDGCGSLMDCGTCHSTQTCGGGGTPSTCGTPIVSCQPQTCTQLNAACGYIGDGCGGSQQCGSCPSTEPCGAGGVPYQCGAVDAGSSCGTLCMEQVVCADGGSTTISGTVFAATDPTAGYGDPDPLPNAIVYVPSGTPSAFTDQVSCDVCGTPASGDPLVTATSYLDGGFVLSNVPAGTDVPVVIQLGRWRRQITVPTVNACQNNVLTADQTRMPRNKTEGDIPHIAMVTGAVDSVECVLRKMGIDDTEFANPSNGARVDFYEAPDIFGTYGASGPGGSTPDMETLVSNPTLLSTYDLVIFACTGAEVDQGSTEQTNVINYTNNGGRIYATHYGYVWLFNDPPFDGTANWDVAADNGGDDGPDATTVNDSSLAGWLKLVHASSTLGQISMSNNRNDFLNSVAPSETWLTDQSTGWPLHYTFNTPVGAVAGTQCGRVVYSDFHVENASVDGTAFPGECTVGPMTAQEKVLEYMLFDLSNCVTQTSIVPPGCTPKTCGSQGFNCGEQGDGCGDLIDGGCGTCTAPAACGAGGVPGVCGTPPCSAETCGSLGFNCGPAGDGCGGSIDGGCGTCTAPDTCGGGGLPGVCGEGIQCIPKSCAEQGLACGPAGDGCGNAIGCGDCTPPQTCGGGGVQGQCGMPSCVPQTCATLGYQCGAGGDGCGGIVECGVCDGGTCGGSSRANQCGKFEFE